MTTYDHISRNNWLTASLVVLLPVMLFALIWTGLYLLLIFQEMGANSLYKATQYTVQFAPFIVLGGLGWMSIAYYFGGNMILRSAKAEEINKRDDPPVYRLVENTAIAAGLPTPKIYIIKDISLNAFATGRDPEHASIALTTGIIKKLNKQELEAVIAHEMGHIGNRDIRLMLLIIVGIGFFTFMGELLFRSQRHRSRNNKGGGIFIIIGLVFLIFGYLIAPLIRLAISRRREYLADATSAMITRNPQALASALQKISVDPRVESLDSRPAAAAICISDPRESKKPKKAVFSFFAGISATHPSTDKRIKALQQMDGQN